MDKMWKYWSEGVEKIGWNCWNLVADNVIEKGGMVGESGRDDEGKEKGAKGQRNDFTA